jgi:hypothetical protein
MENVWAYLRQNKLRAQVWDTQEDIVEACASAWRFLTDDPDRIRSIGYRHWACVSL